MSMHLGDTSTGGRSGALDAAIRLCAVSEGPAAVYAVPGAVLAARSSSFPAEDGSPPGIRDAVGRVAASGIPAEMDVEGGGSDGSLRLRLAPVAGAKGVEGVVAWLDDCHAVEHALAAKARFLAAASHDLRQPFQAMRIFHAVLDREVTGETARRAADLLGQALMSGEQLLNALLDISTIDAGTVEPKPDRFDVAALAGRLAREFLPQAEAKGLELRTRLRPAEIETDPVLLERILRNLLANAIHYTRKGGVLLAVRRRDSAVRIEVWDTGFGIPAGRLSAIFDEFVQLENPERDRSRGLGLGLAIVRRLARLLEIPVDVKSRPGRGSVFAITVPVAPNRQPEPDKGGREPKMDVASRTILVVDDEAMVLIGLQMILESWGMRVLAAEDMPQVLQQLDVATPDVILSDLRLRGGLSGFDVIDRVRTMLRSQIPAIILTGETGRTELAEGHQRRMLFLHKPIQADPLRKAIAGALEVGEG